MSTEGIYPKIERPSLLERRLLSLSSLDYRTGQRNYPSVLLTVSGSLLLVDLHAESCVAIIYCEWTTV